MSRLRGEVRQESIVRQWTFESRDKVVSNWQRVRLSQEMVTLGEV